MCKRTIYANGQLAETLFPDDDLARPAVVHRWLGERPHYSKVLCECCWERLSSETPLMGFYENYGDRSFPIVSGAPYTGELRDLIHRFKYEGDRLLAPDLAAIMLGSWRLGSIFVDKAPAVLVPIPLHWKKRIERGYNQSELLAQEAARILEIPVAAEALKRKRPTTPQQSLEKLDRFLNVADAFVANGAKLSGKTVVLVDDICTSGATLSECVREVYRSGAANVVALTVARTLLRKGRISGNGRSSLLS